VAKIRQYLIDYYIQPIGRFGVCQSGLPRDLPCNFRLLHPDFNLAAGNRDAMVPDLAQRNKLPRVKSLVSGEKTECC